MLVTRPLDERLVGMGLGPGVDYTPTPNRNPVGSGVWVAPDAITHDDLNRWRDRADQAGHAPVIVTRPHESIRRACLERGIELRGPLEADGGRPDDLALLAAAERAEQQAASAAYWRELGIGADAPPKSQGGSVLLVGAGIVNLVTAYALVEAGYEVELLDAGPDPRTGPDWRRMGATGAGLNARMFCITEADNYNEKSDAIYDDMDMVWRRQIDQGGWLLSCEGTRNPAFTSWLERFEAVPAWRALLYEDDIHRFSRASGPLWAEMREHLPHLFEGSGFTNGILRLYSETEAFESAVVKQTRVGALRRVLTPEQLAARHSGLAPACKSGEIVGAIEVVGFTVNVHDFCRGLLDWLELRGARCTWNTRAAGWHREGDVVRGVELTDGRIRTATHYVASPGAYGHELLRGTRSEGLLTGVGGLWLTMPNTEPELRHSMKIHRDGHVGEDSNVTIGHDSEGRPTLILGSGYAIVGHQHEIDLDSANGRALYHQLTETVRRFFPRQYALGPDVGYQISPRACIRPFTPTGLGLFDGLRAEDGLAVITGGHNTGGFAQSPAVGAAVVATLRGRPCAMQRDYDPRRGQS